jgi:hypothetical protein
MLGRTGAGALGGLTSAGGVAAVWIGAGGK